jgi:hypothetical protein
VWVPFFYAGATNFCVLSSTDLSKKSPMWEALNFWKKLLKTGNDTGIWLQQIGNVFKNNMELYAITLLCYNEIASIIA